MKKQVAIEIWTWAKHHFPRLFSYRLRVSMMMAFFAVIPVSLLSVFFLNSEKLKWEENAVASYSEMLAIISEQFDQSVNEMKLKALYARNSASIRAIMAKVNQMDMVESLDFIYVLRETVESLTADSDDLAIRWYPYLSTRDYGNYCYTMDKFREEFAEGDELLGKILNMDTGQVFTAVRCVSRGENNGGPLQERFCVYTKMVNINGSNCLLEMSMPIDRMIDLESIGTHYECIVGTYLTLDSGNRTLLFTVGDAVRQEQTLEERPDKVWEQAEAVLSRYHESGDSEAYYPTQNQIDSLPGSQFTCLTENAYVLAQIRRNTIVYLAIMLLFVFTILVCSYAVGTMLTIRVTRSIEKMNNELDTILEKPSVAVIHESDFEGIERRIRKLIRNVQQYYVQIEQYEEEKNRLELELLQMRFNPHFLYNTLTSISYQTEDERIRGSIQSLIHYYRIVLSKGYLVIHIEEEIAMIREYLELQKFAYRLENIKFVFEIDEAVNSFTIVKHLLQPIVENALEHGLRVMDREGTIWIRAWLVGDEILFEIEDNGAGMTKEQILHVLSEPARGSVGGGYGIYNVQQRIETYYGSEYGIHFTSKPGVGTKAVIRIPKTTDMME